MIMWHRDGVVIPDWKMVGISIIAIVFIIGLAILVSPGMWPEPEQGQEALQDAGESIPGVSPGSR